MIENKLVKIHKDNNVDNGWALFDTYSDIIIKNAQYKGVQISDVVKKITYATGILLILQNNCLPRAIVEELVWVNKYIEFTVIVKSKQILEKYGDLKFSKVIIDDEVGLNYLAIDGTEDKSCYLLGEEIAAIDDAIECALLGRERSRKYEWVSGDVQEIFVIDGNGQLEHKDLLDLCIAKKIKAAYVCDAVNYNKGIYDLLSDTPIKILVSKVLKSAIIFIEDNRLYCINEFKGTEVITEIADIDRFIQGAIFENLKLKECLNGSEIPQKAYFIDAGEIKCLSVEDSMTVSIEVKGLSMKDFIEEKFDSSITDAHNEYRFKAKRVEYRFTLVPPIFDDTYSYSNIYAPIKDIYDKWEKNFTVVPGMLRNEIKEFGHFQCWEDFIDLIKQANEYLSRTVTKYNYSGFHSMILNYINKLKAENDTLTDKFLQLHDSIAGESLNAQYAKFDEEIEGYRRTIEEKRILIGQDKDVISNNRRIEILEKKIEDLSALKQRFNLKSCERKSEAQNEFIKKCQKLLNGKDDESEVDSVSNVINTGEPTKIVKLDLFTDKWLKKISGMLENGILLLEKLAAVDIPEDYVVYDKDGKRYMIIDNEEEYRNILPLCGKYKTECVTRR